MAGNFDTSIRSLSDIFSGGAYYRVPRYQRDYSWEGDQLSDLWDDMWNIYESDGDESHYMGCLVLQEGPRSQFIVIDGQQRLATFSIFILACLQELKKPGKNEKKRIKEIDSGFISNTNLGSLEKKYKLTLNRNNDEYYRLKLTSEDPQKTNIKGSEDLMRKAREFFGKKILEAKFNGEKMGAFIDKVAPKLMFTVIKVDNDLNAYKVFETLNDRGVQLSTPDLLKNHLFSVIDPKGKDDFIIDRAEEMWSEIMTSLGRKIPTEQFVRAHWNSRHEMVEKSRLFKKIKETVKTKEEAESNLEWLRASAPIYAALGNVYSDLWDTKEEIRKAIYSLHVFGITQPLTLLLAVYQSDKSDKKGVFEKLCRYVSRFSIRYYPICSRPTKDADRLFNKMAMRARKGADVSELKGMLKELCPGDEEFVNAFKSKRLTSGGKRAKYLLTMIHNQRSRSTPISLFDRGGYTVEHILPKSGSKSEFWRNQFSGSFKQNVNRIGNMTLLSKQDNKKAANADFEEKKRVYAESALSIVKKICEYDEWDAAAVENYQQWLAERAAEVWRV